MSLLKKHTSITTIGFLVLPSIVPSIAYASYHQIDPIVYNKPLRLDFNTYDEFENPKANYSNSTININSEGDSSGFLLFYKVIHDPEQNDDKNFGGKLYKVENLTVNFNNGRDIGGAGLYISGMNASLKNITINQINHNKNKEMNAIYIGSRGGEVINGARPSRFSHVEFNNINVNTEAKRVVGLFASGALELDKLHDNFIKINKGVFRLNGDDSIGVFTRNSRIEVDNSTIYGKGINSVGISSSRAKNVYLPNKSIVTLNNTKIEVEHGTGIKTTDSTIHVKLNNKSTINAKTLIDARVVKSKTGQTAVVLNSSDNSEVIGAVITQKGATSSVNLASNSIWNVTGDSNLSHLNTNDSAVNFQKDGDKFTTTNVDTLSGNNGTYTFAVDVVKQDGSKLIINKSSDGTHIAQGLNDGAQQSTGKEKVILIEDKSGAKAKAIFNPGKDVELGGYAYTVQRDTDNPNNWVLVAKTKPVPPVPPVPPKPVINDTAKTISGLASTSYLMNQAEMATLRQRMGDLTQSSSQSDVSGAWGRMYGGNYKTRNNDNLAKADMNYYGFQLGGDVNTVHYGDNKNYLGMFAGHTAGKPDYVRGSATATSWYGGFYDTFIADDGFYVDSVVKLGQYRNSYNLKDSQDNALNGKGQSSIITLSSQAGKRFMLTENNSYNVYAEPQAQLTYSRIGAFNTTASNGLRVNQGGYNSTVARLGVLLGTQINKQSDIYLKTSYLHEFSKDVKYTLNDSPESYNVKGDGLEAGLGVNVRLNDNGYLYAEGNYINSKSHYTGSKFNIGYRYSF